MAKKGRWDHTANEYKSALSFLVTTACSRRNQFHALLRQHLKYRHGLLPERYASSLRRHKKFYWTGMIAPQERKDGNDEEEEDGNKVEEEEEEEEKEEK